MNKRIFFVFCGLLLFFVFYIFFSTKTKKEEVKFLKLQKGEIKEEILESGVIEKGEPLNLSFEVKGRVAGVFVKEGEEVKKGYLLAKIDPRDYQEALKSAEIALETAKLNLEKIKFQYQQLERGDTLNKLYEDGMNFLAGVFDDMPNTLKSIEDLFFKDELESKVSNIQYYCNYNERFSNLPLKISEEFNSVKEEYKKAIDNYQKATKGKGEEREGAIFSAYGFFIKMGEILKIAKEPIYYLNETLLEKKLFHQKEDIINTHYSSITQFESMFNNYANTLLPIINGIKEYKDKIKTFSFDIVSQELLVKERENNLSQIKKNIEKHYLYAPVDGTILKVNIKEGEMVDLVTKNIVFQILPKAPYEIKVDIYEKDIPKIKPGSWVEINFLAFPNQTFEGEVESISKTEKIKEGVVYYEVKIKPQSLPQEILPGMTCDLRILVNKKENVLVLPKEALKKKEGKYYVEILEGEEKDEREVEIGISSEEFVEVVSGLSEGEKVILSKK